MHVNISRRGAAGLGVGGTADLATDVRTLSWRGCAAVQNVHAGCSFGDLIVRSIAQHGDRVAFQQGDRWLSYRKLGEQISQVCQVFEEHGLRKGDGVAHLTQNCPEEFIVSAAAYIAGLRYVPLHPRGSLDDFSYIIGDSEASAVVIQTGTFPEVAAGLVLPSDVVLFSHSRWEGGVDLFRAAGERTPAPLVVRSAEDDIARVAYTGGTTGRPKGVMQSHRSLVACTVISVAEMEWPQDLRFLCCTPMSHATAYLIMPVLTQGGTFVLQTNFSPANFCEQVERFRITSTFLVPTMIYSLLDDPVLDRHDMSSLQHVLYGASPASPTRLREAMKRFGPVFQQAYGLTESPNCITTLKPAEHLTDDDQRFSSCGIPYMGMQVVVQDDDGQLVPSGSVGEVCVRGPLVMQGYWHTPEETAAAMSGDWFHTGDMGYFDDRGLLFLVDRKKDMIISGGFNVYAREVEDVLTAHPAVAQAAVIGVPDKKWGEAVKALVVLRSGSQVSGEELISAVKQAKGSVQAPKSVDFVDGLPVTAIGKLDKKAIRAPFWKDSQRQVH